MKKHKEKLLILLGIIIYVLFLVIGKLMRIQLVNSWYAVISLALSYIPISLAGLSYSKRVKNNNKAKSYIIVILVIFVYIAMAFSLINMLTA